MAQPTPFVRGFSFTDFATATPAAPPPGVRLDAEFDAVGLTLEEVLRNLALIQRDDGRLANASVRLATLHSEVIAALTLIGAEVLTWATGTAYTQGQIVVDGDDVYFVAIDHTSGVLATDAAAERLIRVFDSGFDAGGVNSISRTMQEKVRETPRSLVDHGSVSDLTTDNSDSLEDAIASLPTFGGVIHVNGGVRRGNFLIDQDCVRLEGDAGTMDYNFGYGFHGAFAEGLRPFDTGAGTATLQLGNNDQDCRRLALNNLVISGDDGTGPVGPFTQGNQAEAALLLKGGVVHLSAQNLNLRDGTVTLDMQPGGGFPITCNFFSHFDWRNFASAPASRTLRMRRPADPDYLTAVYFCNGHINGPQAGYAVELDGTGGPGITWEVVNTYCDITAGCGVLLKGSASIDAWNLTLDPGATGVVVVETDEMPGSDITNYISGHVKHGGQKFQYGDGSTKDIPSTTQHFFRGPRIFQPFLSDLIYFTEAADPFDTSVYLDWQTTGGPMRLNGIKFRFMDTADATSASTGAVGTSGGISAAKSIYAGAKVTSTTGFYIGANQLVGSRSTGWTAMTGSGSKGALAAAAAGTASVGYVQAELQAALNRIAAIEARLKANDDALFAHGLIGA